MTEREPPRTRKRGPAKRNPHAEAGELEARAARLMQTAAVTQAEATRLYARAAAIREQMQDGRKQGQNGPPAP